ncbi:hypothetical protein LOAG_00440 [Loa loa]|uniref:Uncharacterized protein n=1 Tax=Loa loa TaxID=7209 RepID=A0A1S0UB63_LOALO|nr:hypothetical protein LOAG_00440 [Loa loa]EFO28048.1 hypothetical protein LOAG_00440 [Loa loa]
MSCEWPNWLKSEMCTSKIPGNCSMTKISLSISRQHEVQDRHTRTRTHIPTPTHTDTQTDAQTHTYIYIYIIQKSMGEREKEQAGNTKKLLAFRAVNNNKQYGGERAGGGRELNYPRHTFI